MNNLFNVTQLIRNDEIKMLCDLIPKLVSFFTNYQWIIFPINLHNRWCLQQQSSLWLYVSVIYKGTNLLLYKLHLLSTHGWKPHRVDPQRADIVLNISISTFSFPNIQINSCLFHLRQIFNYLFFKLSPSYLLLFTDKHTILRDRERERAHQSCLMVGVTLSLPSPSTSYVSSSQLMVNLQ